MDEKAKGWRNLLARFRTEARETLRSLNSRSFRVYQIGQFVSLCGTWMQAIALSWLVYKLSKSAMTLGIVSFASTVPVLLLSFFAGGVADRFNRRKILIITQVLEMLQAGLLAFLTIKGLLTVPLVVALAAFLGLCSAFEMPARQAFVADIVGRSDLANAIGINSALFNLTRMIGPVLAGVCLAAFGEGICFLLNAVSFLAALLTLRMVTVLPQEQRKPEQTATGLQQSLWSVIRSSGVVNILLLIAVISIFGFQFSVLMPVIVDDLLHGQAAQLSVLTAAIGVGALIGALVLARRGKVKTLTRVVGVTMLWLGAGLATIAWSRSLTLSAAAAAVAGLCICLQLGGSNFILQMSVPEQVRGRVMGVYSFFMVGLAPFGGLLAGWFAHMLGVSLAVTITAVVCAAAGAAYLWHTPRATQG